MAEMTLREFQSKGGRTRAQIMSREAKAAVGHAAGLLRWERWSDEQRRAHIAKMNAGYRRWHEQHKARLAALQQRLDAEGGADEQHDG
jgi:hypothetical protein